jgi:glycogen phosphorylase
MKAAANGALNLSVGDGWWPEAYDGSNGWLVGPDRPAAEDVVQDELDAASVHDLLEREVAPLFFDRDADGVPRAWLERVRRSLATIPPVFDTARMVAEYRDRAYLPMARRHEQIRADGWAVARTEAARRVRLATRVAAARVVAVGVDGEPRVGAPVRVHATVELGALADDEVAVEFVVGRRRGGELSGASVVALAPEGDPASPRRRFSALFTPDAPGSFGYMARVRPRGEITSHEAAAWG